MTDAMIHVERYGVNYIEHLRNLSWELAFDASCQGNAGAYKVFMNQAHLYCQALDYMEKTGLRFITKEATINIGVFGPMSTREASGLAAAEVRIVTRPASHAKPKSGIKAKITSWIWGNKG